MALTLEETNSLIGALNLEIPESILKQKAAQEDFEKRWAALGPKISKAATDMDNGRYGGDPTSGKVRVQVIAFSKAKTKVEKAMEALDYAAALPALNEAENALTSLESAFATENAKAKVEYQKVKVAFQPTLDRISKAITANAYGNPPHPDFAGLINAFGRGKKTLDDAEAVENYLRARDGLEQAKSAPFHLAVQKFDAAWSSLKARADKLNAGISTGTYKGMDDVIQPFKAAMTAATGAVARAKTNEEYGAAFPLMDKLEQALTDIRSSATKKLTGLADQPAKAAREKAMAFLKQDPDVLKALADQPGGPQLLDKLVGDLKGSAKDADSKGFIRSAIKARFGPDLTDQDLTSKYLPRLYNVLGKVPASHAKGNPMLQSINRKRTKLDTSGDYLDGKINLNAPRTGLADSFVSFGANLIPGTLSGIGISQFDLLTLHEVGHAVDDSKKFMVGKKGDDQFGGWDTHNVGQVADAVGDGKGFYQDYKNKLPQAFLRGYLEAVLNKKDPANETALTSLLDKAKPAPNWKALGKHPAVACCEKIRLKSEDSGLWEEGDSGASKYAVGKRVFQESYSGSWVSYTRASRSAKISSYQFRAEGEWYAEAYAAFFVGKLSKSHPLSSVLEADRSAAPKA